MYPTLFKEIGCVPIILVVFTTMHLVSNVSNVVHIVLRMLAVHNHLHQVWDTLLVLLSLFVLVIGIVQIAISRTLLHVQAVSSVILPILVLVLVVLHILLHLLLNKVLMVMEEILMVLLLMANLILVVLMVMVLQVVHKLLLELAIGTVLHATRITLLQDSNVSSVQLPSPIMAKVLNQLMVVLVILA